jgi:hypothetical protein
LYDIIYSEINLLHSPTVALALGF